MLVKQRRGVVVAGVLAVGTVVVGGACPEGVEVVPYLLEGDDAPGTGARFATFDRPNLSEAGAIGFGGETDAPSDARDVVYVGLTLVAREGTSAPGVPGGTYSAFEFFETTQQVNAAGDLAYIATLRDVPTDTNRAVYRNGDLIAREGEAAPEIPQRVYVDFGFAGVTDDGAVGFRADLDGSTSDDSVIYLDDRVLYREGDDVPGVPNVRWDGDFDEVQWNGRGDVLFEGDTTLPGGDKVVFRRLDTASAGVVEEIVAREGQVVDARDGEDFLELILQNAIAANGAWALRGNLGIAPSDADAIVLSEVGVQAQQGDPVPELPGVVLGNFNGVAVNSLGDVVYLADLEGDTPPNVEEGLFVNGCLLVTDGTQVPGLPEGTRFSDLGFEDFDVNDARQMVFAASYTGAVIGDGLFTMTLPAACPEDIDGNGAVEFADLLVILTDWGPYDPCPPYLAADVDKDCMVAFSDILAVLSAWGPCP